MTNGVGSIKVGDLLTALQSMRQYLDSVVAALEQMDPDQNLEFRDPNVFLEPPPVMYSLFARCESARNE